MLSDIGSSERLPVCKLSSAFRRIAGYAGTLGSWDMGLIWAVDGGGAVSDPVLWA